MNIELLFGFKTPSWTHNCQRWLIGKERTGLTPGMVVLSKVTGTSGVQVGGSAARASGSARRRARGGGIARAAQGRLLLGSSSRSLIYDRLQSRTSPAPHALVWLSGCLLRHEAIAGGGN